MKTDATVERFWSKVDVRGDDECWLWLAGLHQGYGVFFHGRRSVRAHRFAYELLVGPIPDGLQTDHLCRNRACVNPAHIEPVTSRENTLRGEGLCGQNARKVVCIRGHYFTPENTYHSRKGRECRKCRAFHARTTTVARKAARRAAKEALRDG